MTAFHPFFLFDVFNLEMKIMQFSLGQCYKWEREKFKILFRETMFILNS